MKDLKGVPPVGSGATTPVMPPAVCGECGVLKDGWRVRGTFYCRECWLRWNPKLEKPSTDVPIPDVPSTFVPSTSAKRTRRCLQAGKPGLSLTSSFGGCPCCGDASLGSPADTSAEGGWIQDKDGLYTVLGCWVNLGPDLEELHGLTFIDAHAHIDCMLQNRKHGGPGWDSKQRLCKYWLMGACPFTAKCEFAHGEEEMAQRVYLELSDIEPFLFEFAKHCSLPERAGTQLGASSVSTASRRPTALRVVTSCCELESIPDTRMLLTVADRIVPETFFCTLGCHPHNYRAYSDAYEERLLREVEDLGRHVIAWGECGLDYCKNEDEFLVPAERQRMVDVFARQARIAAARGLPLVVHSRDAPEDTISVLRDCLPVDHRVYIHAFQGATDVMLKILDMMPNSVFGVSGMVMLKFPADNVIEIAKHIPLDRLVLETDAPYLSNDPREIPRLAVKIASLRGDTTPAAVLKASTVACDRFYGFPPSSRSTIKIMPSPGADARA